MAAGVLAMWICDALARRLLRAWWGRRVVAELAADLATMAPRGPQT